ncbi:MAG: oligosaccharide flippase family protein [Candidatus Kuenenia stuttgartiensis]|nr:oligosaccharide flippase family protein [Candidatus Kuenenia stuttgartiensis]
MKGKLIKSLFSSGLQAVSVQVLGVVFLGIVAYYLSDEEFGIISWANAVSMFITTIIGFGLEQVVVRRIASSSSSNWAAASFLFHVFIGSIISIAFVTIFSYTCTTCGVAVSYLPLFYVAQSLILLIVPLKQFLNAKHIFTPYGVIAIVSNILKLSVAFVLVKESLLSVEVVALVFIGASLVEFIALLIYILSKTDFSFRFKIQAHKKLIKEATPQFLSAIFDTTLSRIDWILLGIIGVSYTATAAYSFAYRAYELSRLPIVIIAPVILNIFASQLAKDGRLPEEKKALVNDIFKVEAFAAVLIPLIISIIWAPLLDSIPNFAGKYGSKNETEFIILSVCIPIHFFINLLWTLSFSARKYKKITTITIITASSNVVLNLVLIPLYSSVGAAVAYLLTTIIQAAFFYKLVLDYIIKVPVRPMLLFMLIAFGAYLISAQLHINLIIKVLVALSIYITTGFITRIIRIKNLLTLLTLIRK